MRVLKVLMVFIKLKLCELFFLSLLPLTVLAFGFTFLVVHMFIASLFVEQTFRDLMLGDTPTWIALLIPWPVYLILLYLIKELVKSNWEKAKQVVNGEKTFKEALKEGLGEME